MKEYHETTQQEAINALCELAGDALEFFGDDVQETDAYVLNHQLRQAVRTVQLFTEGKKPVLDHFGCPVVLEDK